MAPKNPSSLPSQGVSVHIATINEEDERECVERDDLSPAGNEGGIN